LLTVI
jgi:hypothetical protein